MQRITISVDDDLLEQFDALIRERGYGNRSEAFRDLVRDRLERERLASVSAPTCVGCLTYVYDHAMRELPRRLTLAQHAHHEISIATVHLHLDHDNCLEAAILRGRTEDVKGFAAEVITQRGVRHGHLWLVPVDLRLEGHHHGAGEQHDHDPGADDGVPELPHVHSRPKT